MITDLMLYGRSEMDSRSLYDCEQLCGRVVMVAPDAMTLDNINQKPY